MKNVILLALFACLFLSCEKENVNSSNEDEFTYSSADIESILSNSCYIHYAEDSTSWRFDFSESTVQVTAITPTLEVIKNMNFQSQSNDTLMLFGNYSSVMNEYDYKELFYHINYLSSDSLAFEIGQEAYNFSLCD